MIADTAKAAALLAVAAIAQVSIVNAFELAEGRADITLLCIVGIALLRGPIFGACAGFFAGLIVDVGDARDARAHVAPAHPRRLLGGTARRGDEPSPQPARPHPDRGHAAHDRHGGGLDGPPSAARRVGTGGYRGRPRDPALARPQPDPRGSGLCALPAPLPAARAARPGVRGCLAASGPAPIDSSRTIRGSRSPTGSRRRWRSGLRSSASSRSLVFAVLFFRLWALQVISGNEYQREARDNQIRTFRLQPPRGPVLDRDGEPLVTNVPGTVVQLWPAVRAAGPARHGDRPPRGGSRVPRRAAPPEGPGARRATR